MTGGEDGGAMRETHRGRNRITRRDALRILAVGGAAGVAFKLGLLESRARPVTRSRVLMGTGVRLQLIGEDPEAAELAAEATLAEMSRLEALLTRYRPDSELARLNASGRVEDASDALLDVLRLAERVSRLGDGAFDVSVQPLLDLRRRQGRRRPSPEEIEAALDRVGHREIRIGGRTVTLARAGMTVTLDGIAKGYIVDRGVAELRRSVDSRNVFVEAGGDLIAGGEREPGHAVAHRHPQPALGALAAAGAIRRPRSGRCHLGRLHAAVYAPDFSASTTFVDPRTGSLGAPELASSTVDRHPTPPPPMRWRRSTMVLGPRAGT